VPTASPGLDPSAPWLQPAPVAQCAEIGLTPEQIPVVEVVGAPCSVAEVIALRSGRSVPLYGRGATRAEAVRALANLVRALGGDADPRGADYALGLALHPLAGPAPLRTAAQSVLDGTAPACAAQLALAYVRILGADDTLRERVARELVGPPTSTVEVSLALGVGGGDYGSFRDHYAVLVSSSERDELPVRVARAWFDFVLARRFAGLDTMQSFDVAALDPASHWLITSAEHVHGDLSARTRMAEIAERLLAPVGHLLPRLTGVVAREMAEIVQHPMRLRYQHLRCAAARDHAAVAIRAWLHAAIEGDHEGDEPIPGTEAMRLGPEPSRAGRAAMEARAAAGEFLLDWYVPEREARESLDRIARRVLRLYHRLRGVQALVAIERELRPSGSERSGYESLVWPTGAIR